MSTLTASRALEDLDLLIKLALGSGYSLERTVQTLEECHPNKQVANALPPAPDLEKLTVAVVRSYLGILDCVAQHAGTELPQLKSRVLSERRSRLVRTLFDTEPDPEGFSELRLTTVKEIIARLEEIPRVFGIPWDDFVQRVYSANGKSLIGKLLSGPEVQKEPQRTLKEILVEHPKGKPPLHDYQKKIVKSFRDSIPDRSRMHVVWLPTGGGKTRIANECAHGYLKGHPGARVLWLAPNWLLLEQAAVNMAACFGRDDELRYAGNGDKFLGLERFDRRDPAGRIVYSTLHSWYNGDARLYPHNDGSLMVVYDESHWGMDAKMLKSVFRSYRGKAVLLGLSATPRDSKWVKVLLPQYSYADLHQKGYLARPIVKQVVTGVQWNPILTPSGHLFTQGSLAVLADDERRNRLIVETLVRRQDDFNKVLVFACNRNHADTLDDLLRRHNVASATFHTGIDRPQRAQRLLRFREGALKVLVSVNMAIHGIDIPEIDCVVLARPTESAALCSQMVGRGARKTPEKDSFHILEFTDNVLRHGERIFHCGALFPAGIGARPPGGNSRRPASPHCEPDRVHFQQLVEVPGVEGVPYTLDHSFGVEIELTCIPGPLGETVPGIDSEQWRRIAQGVIACIGAAGIEVSEEPTGYHEGDPGRWRVEQDISCGWEVISPPLRNEAGFKELHAVCEALRRHVEGSRELMVDFTCGLHITLSTRLSDNAALAGFLRRVQRIEPGLFTLVKPSRLFRTHRHGYQIRNDYAYCRPVRSCCVDDLEIFDPRLTNRCNSVNITKARLSDFNLVEIRMHHGTLDYREIIPWISLWMHIFNSSRFQWRGNGCVGKVFRGGDSPVSGSQIDKDDILTLIDAEEIPINSRLRSALLEKRTAMKPFWESALPQRVESWEVAGWYD